MQLPQLPPKTRGLTAMTGAMVLIAVLLMVQVWLLSATLEAFLEGNRAAVIPATVFSFAIFACCLGLYIFVERIDSEVRKPPPPGPPPIAGPEPD